MAVIRRILHRIEQFLGVPEFTGPRIYTNIGRETWLLYGQWAHGQSSFVSAIRYDRNRKELYVRFRRTGFLAIYPNIQERLASDMFESWSLGRFVHSHLYRRMPYRPG